MSLSQLKKDVAVLHKALNSSVEDPKWKKQANEILEILKKLDHLSIDEKQRQNAEVLTWYAFSSA